MENEGSPLEDISKGGWGEPTPASTSMEAVDGPIQGHPGRLTVFNE
jgi:hypothetical protein